MKNFVKRRNVDFWCVLRRPRGDLPRRFLPSESSRQPLISGNFGCFPIVLFLVPYNVKYYVNIVNSPPPRFRYWVVRFGFNSIFKKRGHTGALRSSIHRTCTATICAHIGVYRMRTYLRLIESASTSTTCAHIRSPPFSFLLNHCILMSRQ